MISRRSRLQFLLPAALLIAGIAGAEVPQPAAPVQPPAAPQVPRTLDVPDGALVAAGQAPEIDVLYTGDVIGFIEPCG